MSENIDDSSYEDSLNRINTLISSTRGVWFGLLGVLVFAGVTLLGVKDIDFYGLDRTTQLPLVNISVPVTSFFSAGAALVAAVYIYFHLYLVQILEELGEFVQRHDKPVLANVISPWLVSATMLQWRNFSRNDGSANSRPLGWIGALATFSLVWGFGPTVLFLFWWRYLPAKETEWTVFLGLLFFFGLAVSIQSLFYAQQRLSQKHKSEMGLKIAVRIVAFIVVLTIISVSLIKTDYISPRWSGTLIVGSGANLCEQQFSPLPRDWQDWHTAKNWFLKDWADREGLTKEVVEKDRQHLSAAIEEFQARRRTYREFIGWPDWSGKNFEKACMIYTFLPNAILRSANLNGADLNHAQLEGAEMGGAMFVGADLDRAKMAEVDLNNAVLTGANLHKAHLELSKLTYANFKNANLSRAIMSGANLTGANLTGANLSKAILSDVDFTNATLDGALITLAASSPKPTNRKLNMDGSRFSIKSLKFTALIDVDLSTVEKINEAELKKAFGDLRAILPPNIKRPCHWASDLFTNSDSDIKAVAGKDKLDTPKHNDPLIGRWRGWVEANGGAWPTSERFAVFKDVEPIKPLDKNGKMCPLIKDMQ